MDQDGIIVATPVGSEIEVTISGLGRDIVLLPSLGRGSADFAPLTPLLVAAGFRVILPEPRGIGASQGPMEGITLDDLAADIAAVVEACCAEPPIVAGHAFGNFVARMLATKHPGSVRGVALLAASVGKAPEGETLFDDEVIASVFSSGDLSLPDDERRAHLKRAFFAPGNDADIWLPGWYPEVKAAQSAASQATPPEIYLSAGSTVPVLHVQAELDTVAPARFQVYLGNFIDAARLSTVTVAGAGHALIPEQPVLTATYLAAWAKERFPDEKKQKNRTG